MRMVIEQREAGELPERPDHYSPDEQYQYKETSATVKQTIARLSQGQRAAFTLIKEEERSYKEAAELSGVPVSTLEKRVVGSLRILRKALALFF